MMRANLLPRPRETLGIFGINLDFEYLRTAVFGLAIVVTVAALGFGIEQLRLHRLETSALALEARFATRAPERTEMKRLALEVARYQEFAREAESFRRSGPDAAGAIARIGNSVPQHVSLESLNREAHGYHLTGRSSSVDMVGGAILALGRAIPATSASLVDMDNRAGADDGTRFSAKISTDPTTSADPSPLPPLGTVK